MDNIIDKTVAVIETIENLLNAPAFKKRRDLAVIKITRVALLRELFWADQLITALNSGAAYDEAFRCMFLNSDIVDTHLDELAKCMEED
jgi:hypothetical protein